MPLTFSQSFVHAESCQCVFSQTSTNNNKKHLKNVGPIRHNEPPHAHSADVAIGTVACHLHIDVHDDINNDDDNDNA